MFFYSLLNEKGVYTQAAQMTANKKQKQKKGLMKIEIQKKETERIGNFVFPLVLL